MACCNVHDRMDKVLNSDEYYDTLCGTPTGPRGEKRFCCGKCPEQTNPLRLQATWASNPTLMSHLTGEQYARVIVMAMKAGPRHVDIVVAVPAPVDNGISNDQPVRSL